jgi:hypothetical protein
MSVHHALIRRDHEVELHRACPAKQQVTLGRSECNGKASDRHCLLNSES